MENGLEAVDWGALRHFYGPAGETPEHLRAVAGPDPVAARASRHWLSSNLNHQGSVWTCTAAALPFLIDALAAPDTPDRADLCSLILWWVGPPGHPFEASIEAAFGEVWDRTVAPEVLRELDQSGDWDNLSDAASAVAPWVAEWIEAQCYRAFAARPDVWLRCLADDDAALRMQAMYAASWLIESVTGVLPAVQAQAQRETGPVHRANGAIATGALGRLRPDQVDTAWLAGWLDAPDDLVRWSAALALGLVQGEGLSERALTTLIDAQSRRADVMAAGKPLPWSDGNLLGDLNRVLHRLGL